MKNAKQLVGHTYELNSSDVLIRMVICHYRQLTAKTFDDTLCLLTMFRSISYK
jgi:hypothetical protein